MTKITCKLEFYFLVGYVLFDLFFSSSTSLKVLVKDLPKENIYPAEGSESFRLSIF